MKALLVFSLLSLLTVHVSQGASPVYIDLFTDGTITKYTLNNRLFSRGELRNWITAYVKQSADTDAVIITPNEQTTFMTVVDLLQILSTAGVKQIEIRTESKTIKTVSTAKDREEVTEMHRGIRLTPENLRDWTDKNKRLTPSPP